MSVLKKILLIGSFEKDSGKTSLSERIIGKFKDRKIYAVKITVSRTDEEIEKYSITEEIVSKLEKDTGRLKLAGAEKVFWLKCNSFSAKKAISELLNMISDNVFVLCESNMARKYFKPAVFIMVKRDSAGKPKETAKSVEKFADMITISSVVDDGLVYSPDIADMIRIEDGEWKLV